MTKGCLFKFKIYLFISIQTKKLKMQTKNILISSVILFLGINLYSCTCFSITFFHFITIFAITFGIFFAILVHILLSSTYKTGIRIEPVYKELEYFRNKILVSFNFAVFMCFIIRRCFFRMNCRKVQTIPKNIYLLY